MSEQTTITQLGDQLFGTGVDGALLALGKTYELAFMKVLSQASSTTAGAMSDQSANIDVCRDISIYQVSQSVAELLAQSAATETDPRVAEALKYAVGQLQDLSAAAANRIIQASPYAEPGETVVQAIAQTLQLSDELAQGLLSPTPGAEWSAYQITEAARDLAEQSQIPSLDASDTAVLATAGEVTLPGIDVVVASVTGLATSLQDYIGEGNADGWHAIAAHAGGAALRLNSLFENGDASGLQVNQTAAFFEDANLTAQVSQLLAGGTVDSATVGQYLSETELAAWLVDAVDSGVTLEQFNQMVDGAASSTDGLAGVQALVDGLREILADGAAPSASMDQSGFYQSVLGSVEGLQAAYPDGLKIESLLGRTADSIASAAADSGESGLAYRYALDRMNGFVVVGADYGRFNSAGELDLYSTNTSLGTFTAEYLAARPDLLAALLNANVADLPADASGALQAPDASGAYVDRDLGLAVAGGDPQAGVTIFDGDSNAPLIGTAAADRLFGGAGNDVLDGKAGADEMVGGSGDDTYYVDNAGDRVAEYADQGSDTVFSSVSFSLGDNLENLTLTGNASLSGTGNALGNTIYGNDGANVLSGDNGDDVLDGGAGDDTLIGGTGNDVLVAGVGRDTLFGGAGDDVLIGGDGDVLDGGTGKDTFRVTTGATVVDGGGRGQIFLGRLDAPLSGGDRVTGQPFYVGQDGQVVYRGNEDGSLQGWGDGQRITVRPSASDYGPRSRSADGSSSLDAGEAGRPVAGKPTLGLPLRDAGGPSDPSYKSPFLAAMGTPAPRRDPLLLDLDGDGIETQGTAAVTFFDHDANGFAELTGWAGSEDGMLVMDRNGDGRISSGRELFGDQTMLQSGKLAASGAEALAEWDLSTNGGNADGVIDANDAVWDGLRVWRDVDGDGFTDGGELLSLADAGIASLSLNFSSDNVADGFGNLQARTASFTRADGSSGAMGDYLLARNTTISIADNPVAVGADVAALPEVRASGNVLDLRQAMARDNALRDLVQAFTAESDTTRRGMLLDQMLFRWTGADDVDPGSRGNTMDARQLVALEKFVGADFVGALGADPVPDAALKLIQGYQDLREQVNAKLMVQSQLQALYDSISFSWDAATQSVRADLSTAMSQIDGALAISPAAGRVQLSEFARALRGLRELSSLDYQQLRAHYAAMGEDMAIAFDTGGLNVISSTAGGIRIDGSNQAESLVGSDQGDTVTAYDGNDIVYGLGGDDVISGCEGDDQIFGGLGNDNLFGAVGNDLVDGAAGNDFLDGGTGNDTYVLSRGTGRDVIRDYDATAGNLDTIRVDVGIAPSEVAYWRSGNDLLVGIAGTEDILRVQDWYVSAANRVERVAFADGTSITADMLAAARIHGTQAADAVQGSDGADYIEGLGGNDVIMGTWGDDVIDGGAGDDTLYGGWSGYFGWAGAGNDTYLFGRGSGNDTIYDYDATPGNVDTLRLAGLTLKDVTIRRDASSFYVSINDTGETVRVADWGGGQAYRIERIEFSDGMVLAGNDLNALMLGTAANDNMIGSAEADLMYGLAGNDALLGGLGDDTLDGGAGDDTLYGGFSGYFSSAGAGNDTYIYGRGYGNDTVYDYDTTSGNVDTVKLVGLNAQDVTIGRDSNTWFLTVNATGETLRVADWGGGSAFRIEQVMFADGSVLDGATLAKTPYLGTAGSDTMTGTALDDAFAGLGGNDVLSGGVGNDILDGGAGDDVLYGGFQGYFAGAGAGNDTYVFGRGYGNDIVYDYDGTAGNVDTIQLRDLNASDVTLRRDAATFYLTVNATGETLRVGDWGGGSAYRIERVVFGDGSVLQGAALAATPYLGTDAIDSFLGTAEGEVFKGRGGNDQISGGGGDDVIAGDAGTDLLRGDDGNDMLSGGDGNDTLYGGNANDLIDGGAGADLMYGNLGDDAFWVDNVSDRVIEGTSQGTDTVLASISHALGSNVENLSLLGSANLNGTGNALNNVLRGNSGDNMLSGGAGDDWLVGGDGKDTLDGGINTDILQAGNGDDQVSDLSGNVALDGGAGNDALTAAGTSFIAGGAGNDLVTASGTAAVVAVNSGDGNDVLRATAQRTTLSVGAGVSYADIALHKSGSDLVVELGKGTSVTLEGWYNSGVAKPQFLTLQVMAEAMAGFDAASTDPLLNQRVQQFDLQKLAGYYDAAATADPTVDRWAVMNQLLDAHLAGSDTAAAGGDLARYYANLGTLSGMSLAAAQDTARSASFGQANQTLNSLDVLQQGAVKLA